MLTPAFHFKILEDFMEVFNKHSQTFVNKLLLQDGKEAFNIFPYCTLCTLDIILGKDIFYYHLNILESILVGIINTT